MTGAQQLPQLHGRPTLSGSMWTVPVWDGGDPKRPSRRPQEIERARKDAFVAALVSARQSSSRCPGDHLRAQREPQTPHRGTGDRRPLAARLGRRCRLAAL